MHLFSFGGSNLKTQTIVANHLFIIYLTPFWHTAQGAGRPPMLGLRELFCLFLFGVFKNLRFSDLKLCLRVDETKRRGKHPYTRETTNCCFYISVYA